MNAKPVTVIFVVVPRVHCFMEVHGVLSSLRGAASASLYAARGLVRAEMNNTSAAAEVAGGGSGWETTRMPIHWQQRIADFGHLRMSVWGGSSVSTYCLRSFMAPHGLLKPATYVPETFVDVASLRCRPWSYVVSPKWLHNVSKMKPKLIKSQCKNQAIFALNFHQKS